MFSRWLGVFTPTWASSGSWAGFGVPAAPPSSQTSWRWRSGWAPLPHPPSGAGSVAPCRRCVSCMSALSRHWKRRCWRHRPSTCPATQSAAAPAAAESENKPEPVLLAAALMPICRSKQIYSTMQLQLNHMQVSDDSVGVRWMRWRNASHVLLHFKMFVTACDK